MNLDKIEIFYIENYRKLLLIPIILLLLSLGLIFYQYQTTGDIINKDISLKGGISATIDTSNEIDIVKLEESFPKDAVVRKLTDTLSREQVGISIQVSDMTEQELRKFLEKELKIKLTSQNFSVRETGSSLGESFYRDLLKAVLFAFLFMGVVVFITFRNFAPSIAVIFAAFTDIVVTLAIVNLTGMRISTAGIVAFLLLIGYSVDTDILLTTRTLRYKDGSPFRRMVESARTGLTMTVTTISALTLALIFTTNPTLQQMFLIIVIGLGVDILSTYLTNSGILYWYVTRK